jgi:metallo-beta-lactamase family protein
MRAVDAADALALAQRDHLGQRHGHRRTRAAPPEGDGARVRAHHIVFAGFQVGGSRGARLVAGASEVKIHGEYVPVRAEVSQLEGLSGHADANELMAWLRRCGQPPRQTFVVHGEPDAADTLRLRIKDELGWPVRVPQHGETVEV